MATYINRRTFLITAGGAASVAVLGVYYPESVRGRTLDTFVRRDLGELAGNDQLILSYRRAVRAMQALPHTDPLSWEYQAAIHGTLLPDNLTAWSTCEHHNHFFWSWHRMYLYWFERIIRRMANDPSWALPYWNWSSASQRTLPPMFRDGSSELYTPSRDPNMNDGSGSLPATDVDYSPSFAWVDLYTAQTTIEILPHDQIHVAIGGWMRSISTAALDPVFYVHHANMDRLWNLWLAQGGGRADPVLDVSWTRKTYTFFDESGHAVTMTACDILRAAEQLNYTYENEPQQVNSICGDHDSFPWWLYFSYVYQFPWPPVELGSDIAVVPLGLLPSEFTGAIKEGKTVILQLRDVEALNQPGAGWEVYLGARFATIPAPGSAYYLGKVVLFSTGIRNQSHHGFTPAEFWFAINNAVLASPRGTQFYLTFVPRGILVNGLPTRPHVESPVSIGGASLAIVGERQVGQVPPDAYPGFEQ